MRDDWLLYTAGGKMRDDWLLGLVLFGVIVAVLVFVAGVFGHWL